MQGVGFRPFVFRLATELYLTGWVRNSSQGVFVEVEGEKKKLEEFLLRLGREKPSRSFIQSLESSFLDPVGYKKFEIRSSTGGERTALILPDVAVCAACLGEIFDPVNHRYLYPFTNCTHCGPRYSILEALPYDRSNTTMKIFQMCKQCQAEYDSPLDRRFHAQPNACPDCGPHLELWDSEGRVLATHHEALLKAGGAIREGEVVAVKGIGGFHLMVDARNREAVHQLRQRKLREEKPFALMYPSLSQVKDDCEVSHLEERLLLSPESPIVLLKRKKRGHCLTGVAYEVAPQNPYLGVMLPYTPLHALLMAELRFPVVATSGNLSEEPICTDEKEALERLKGIADFFLVHDRPIARPVDDSIARIIEGRELILRRARGYAPLPMHLKESVPCLVAVGAHLKNTVAISRNQEIFLSQHIGDLETLRAFSLFRQTLASLSDLYELRPEGVVSDLHPGYLSTQFAKELNLPHIFVQHHYAHVLSCMAENELEAPVLGVSWDGTGYGPDHTIWGGEFLWIGEIKGRHSFLRLSEGKPQEGSNLNPCEGFKRVAHFRTFRLPGGYRAITEPRRIALGLLYEIFGDRVLEMKELPPLQSFSPEEIRPLGGMLQVGLNAPFTSSAGRLFDAISSLLGFCQRTKFEGQAAMMLEFAMEDFYSEKRYPFQITEEERNGSFVCYVFDWEPMVREVLEDQKRGIGPQEVSCKFHNTLVEVITDLAKRIGEKRVVLTGGCFQNKYLTERAIQRLREEGFRPYWHQRIPPNDGGIAVGQVLGALRELEGGPTRELKGRKPECVSPT